MVNFDFLGHPPRKLKEGSATTGKAKMLNFTTEKSWYYYLVPSSEAIIQINNSIANNGFYKTQLDLCCIV